MRCPWTGGVCGDGDCMPWGYRETCKQEPALQKQQYIVDFTHLWVYEQQTLSSNQTRHILLAQHIDITPPTSSELNIIR